MRSNNNKIDSRAFISSDSEQDEPKQTFKSKVFKSDN